MSLQQGAYIIKSKSTEGAFIGRRVEEDLSLLPKRVVLLPKDYREVPKSSDNTYILRTRGSPTADINELLFGILLPDPEPTKWRIEAQPQHGKNIYTIMAPENGSGWVGPGQEFEQVAVRPLIIAPSIPPRYPTNELFEITLLNE